MHRPWLSHYDYWVPPHLSYPERPLWEILDAAYVDVPDRVATAFLGASLTYRDLKVRSDWFAAALGRLGIGKGDRVGIMLPNCPQYVIAAFGILRLGAIIVNLNPTFTAREIEELAVDSGLRLVVTLEYDQTLVPGPPFSVPPLEVLGHWPDLEPIGRRAVADEAPPKFRAAGVTLVEQVWRSPAGG